MTTWVIEARQPETAGDPTNRNQPGEEIQAHGLLMPGCESSPHLDPLDWVGGDRVVMQKLCLAQRITSAISFLLHAQVLPEVQGGFNVTKQALSCTFFTLLVPRLWASFCHLRFLCPSPMALPVLCSKYAFQSGCWPFYFNTLLHPPPALVQAEDRRQECRLP